MNIDEPVDRPAIRPCLRRLFGRYVAKQIGRHSPTMEQEYVLERGAYGYLRGYRRNSSLPFAVPMAFKPPRARKSSSNVSRRDKINDTRQLAAVTLFLYDR